METWTAGGHHAGGHHARGRHAGEASSQRPSTQKVLVLVQMLESKAREFSSTFYCDTRKAQPPKWCCQKWEVKHLVGKIARSFDYYSNQKNSLSDECICLERRYLILHDYRLREFRAFFFFSMSLGPLIFRRMLKWSKNERYIFANLRKTRELLERLFATEIEFPIVS